ncbi:hypothetical protein cyc_00173 [Cyclospora cayetanensis]|uniref:CCD97-like C-terminal domain-containing protein n=1 Tax=Cyclospora cayetanensis TaxID=88456 RepID=A0A1D3CXL2_9EIME|nr:hypothetical protein cyc_00173 [Cyclospora cayetanensis]
MSNPSFSALKRRKLVDGAVIEECLSSEGTRAELLALLLKHPHVFLERHGKLLPVEETKALGKHFRDRPEVQYYVERLCNCDSTGKGATSAVKLRQNRRLQRMRQLEEEGVFFSEETLKHIEPALYQEIVGRTMLDRAYDIEEEEERLTKQKQVWKAQEDSFYGELRPLAPSDSTFDEKREDVQLEGQKQQPEGAESTEEDEERRQEPPVSQLLHELAPCRPFDRGVATARLQMEQQQKHDLQSTFSEDGEEEATEVSPAEFEDKRREFLEAMRLRFLSGDFPGVDYAAIDADDTLDDANRDLQDAYFDADY